MGRPSRSRSGRVSCSEKDLMMRSKDLTMRSTFLACAALAAFVIMPLRQNLAPAPDAAQEKRLQWFREAKYGLFIHWGLYAIPAGQWHGKRSLGLGEWIMNRSQIPVRD